MEVTLIWSGLLTFAFGLLGWMLKGYVEDLKRVTILVNRTREEIAKEYVTKGEVHTDINRVMNRLEALDAKLDRLLESRINKGIT
jgi:predicted DNA-binding protein YlxM (UPF0122 family)